MSRRSVEFKRKITQSRRGGADASTLIPSARVKSDGHTTIFGQVDSMDDDGQPQKAGKRYPGRATEKVGTEPMSEAKADIYKKLK